MNEEQELNSNLKFNDGNSLMSKSLKSMKNKDKVGGIEVEKQIFFNGFHFI